MRLILSLFLTLGLIASSSGLFGQTVYVTNTGKKFHASDCRYLHSSKIETTCTTAQRAYTACSVCRPQCSVSSGTSSEAASPSTNSSSTTVQCSATTQAGERCKRKTSDESGKCWQHEE